MIDLEHDDCGPADPCPALESRTIPSKVPFPFLSSWVEQTNHGVGVRVDPGEIRLLVAIAPGTGQGEVLGAIVPAMLLRDDVLDVVGELDVFLAEQAILATVPRRERGQRPLCPHPSLDTVR